MAADCCDHSCPKGVGRSVVRLLAAMVDAGGDARHAARMPRCFPATLRPDMTTPTLAFRVPAHATTRSHHYALRQRAATKHTSLNWTTDNPTADTRPSSRFSRGVRSSRSAQRCRVMHHCITVCPSAPRLRHCAVSLSFSAGDARSDACDAIRVATGLTSGPSVMHGWRQNAEFSSRGPHAGLLNLPPLGVTSERSVALLFAAPAL